MNDLQQCEKQLRVLSLCVQMHSRHLQVLLISFICVVGSHQARKVSINIWSTLKPVLYLKSASDQRISFTGSRTLIRNTFGLIVLFLGETPYCRKGLWKRGTGVRRLQATRNLHLDEVQQGLVSEDGWPTLPFTCVSLTGS